jgi:hypothetical protein
MVVKKQSAKIRQNRDIKIIEQTVPVKRLLYTLIFKNEPDVFFISFSLCPFVVFSADY